MSDFSDLEIGQNVRAFDFQPMEGRDDCFIEGKITGVSTDAGFNAFVVRCTKDSWDEEGEVNKGSRVGQVVYVPIEVSFMEYDNRIVVI